MFFLFNFNNGTGGKNNSDLIKEIISWIVIIFCFSVSWLLGIVLLILKVRKGTSGHAHTKSGFGDSQSQRFEKYSAVISNNGHSESIPLSVLASVAGTIESVVIRDLQEMTKRGMLPSGAYINYITKALVLSEPEPNRSSQKSSSSRNEAPRHSAPADDSAASGSSAKEKKRRSHSADDLYDRTCLILLIVGIVLIIAGVAVLSDPLNVIFWLGKEAFDRSTVLELIKGVGLLAGGGISFGMRHSLRKKTQRYKKYLAIIGDKKIISVSDLASSAGISRSTVHKDLQVMIDNMLLGPTAYIDESSNELVLSPDVKAGHPAESPSPDTANEQYADIINKIRRLNDDIKDQDVSSRIYRIEDITTKIFKTVEETPEKLPQIKSFMSYYLPTTLKLLESYATMERQGIDGENIAATKQRIERILDTLVKGFEQQLDQLYESDMLDITSDIDVLESMLAKDGFTDSGSPFRESGGK